MISLFSKPHWYRTLIEDPSNNKIQIHLSKKTIKPESTEYEICVFDPHTQKFHSFLVVMFSYDFFDYIPPIHEDPQIFDSSFK
jgi:hypothetical protein